MRRAFYVADTEQEILHAMRQSEGEAERKATAKRKKRAALRAGRARDAHGSKSSILGKIYAGRNREYRKKYDASNELWKNESMA